MKPKNALNEKIQDELTNEALKIIPADIIDQQIELFAEILIDHFLKDIYEQKQYINHPWLENMAIIDLYDNNQNIRDKTKILDVRSMNSYVNNYQKGDFIIHFAGSQGNIKSLMELYYSKVN